MLTHFALQHSLRWRHGEISPSLDGGAEHEPAPWYEALRGIRERLPPFASRTRRASPRAGFPRRLTRVAVLPLLLALPLLMAACGEPGSETERREVLRVVEAGRDALVAGRPNDACALLTTEGRRRSTEYASGYRRGHDCESTVREMLKEARNPLAEENWLDRAPRAKFEVIDL